MKLIHQEASAESRILATIWISVVWFIKVSLDTIPLLSHMPAAIFKPVGFMNIIPDRFIPHFLSTGSLTSIKCLFLFFLTISVAIEIFSLIPTPSRKENSRSFISYFPILIACGLLTLYQGLFRGFAGHISHEDILLQYALYLFAFFGIADVLYAQKGRLVPHSSSEINLNSIPLVTILFVLCYIYTIVAIFRMTYGGIETFRSDSITYWTIRNTVDYTKPYWGLGQLLLDVPMIEKIFKLGFPFITLVEFLAPISLISRRFRLFFITTIISFHFATWLFMEVIFRETLLMYVLFFDLGKLAKRLGLLPK